MNRVNVEAVLCVRPLRFINIPTNIVVSKIICYELDDKMHRRCVRREQTLSIQYLFDGYSNRIAIRTIFWLRNFFIRSALLLYLII